MSSRQSSQHHGQGEQRPTLPPIRQIFGQELSRSVPPQQSRQPSTSPSIAFRHLSIAEDDPRSARPSSAMGARATAQLSSSRSYPGTPDHAYQTPGHPRGSSDPVHRQAIPGPVVYPSAQPPLQPYQQAYASSGGMRGVDPRTMGSGTYPYAASHLQGQMSGIGAPGGSRPGGDGSSRYECSYCAKGFTRPSSLKIHLNTHTGEKPFVCPFEGCGRSFSVQSNMRRHARVHTRTTAAQQDQDEDDEDAEESFAE